jgi:hypothetical protein
MVKTYLRFELKDTFGVINSNAGNKSIVVSLLPLSPYSSLNMSMSAYVCIHPRTSAYFIHCNAGNKSIVVLTFVSCLSPLASSPIASHVLPVASYF